MFDRIVSGYDVININFDENSDSECALLSYMSDTAGK